MPVIKPRTRGKHIQRHVIAFDRENADTLHAYAAFIDEPTEYVLNQLIETVLAKDKEFVAWRAAHPESYVPPPWRERQREGGTTGRPTATAERVGSPDPVRAPRAAAVHG